MHCNYIHNCMHAEMFLNLHDISVFQATLIALRFGIIYFVVVYISIINFLHFYAYFCIIIIVLVL